MSSRDNSLLPLVVLAWAFLLVFSPGHPFAFLTGVLTGVWLHRVTR